MKGFDNKKQGIYKIVAICLVLLNILWLPLDVQSAKAAKKEEKQNEFHAVWISYLEFSNRLKDPKTGKLGFTKERFSSVINEMFDQVAALGMNAVVVHVRPFGDAFYPSKYFPWSKYISGTQGKNPGFDPLAYMVKAAHKRGLQFHAWINPYRVSSGTTDIKTLSKNNRARKWLTSDNKKQKRRVLSFGGSLYFNPADDTVQLLIRNGIREIVENYDVDGIHFDDYFYPVLGKNYKKNFDYPEYKTYLNTSKKNGEKALSIAKWRRQNVNRLIKRVYKAIKKVDEDIVFGISPSGFLDYLVMNDRYYCDIKTWMSKPGYVDYIAPQIYWSFSHPIYPYHKTLDRWLKLRTNEDVKLYVGIAVYKVGTDEDTEWKKDTNILKKQVEYGRSTKQVDGYIYFRHDFLFKKISKKGVNRLIKINP